MYSLAAETRRRIYRNLHHHLHRRRLRSARINILALRRKADSALWESLQRTAWLYAAMITALGHVSGGHFNPSVTIGFWVVKRFGYLPSHRLLRSRNFLAASAAAYLLNTVIPETAWRPVALGAPVLAQDFTRLHAMAARGCFDVLCCLRRISRTAGDDLDGAPRQRRRLRSWPHDCDGRSLRRSVHRSRDEPCSSLWSGAGRALTGKIKASTGLAPSLAASGGVSLWRAFSQSTGDPPNRPQLALAGPSETLPA